MKKFFVSLMVLVGGFVMANDTVNTITPQGVILEDIEISVDLQSQDAYFQGLEDGKEYRVNKGGNMVVGFLTGLIGTGVVALTSDQAPSAEARAVRGDLVNDINYRRGYSKGAQKGATGDAAIGVAGFLLLILL